MKSELLLYCVVIWNEGDGPFIYMKAAVDQSAAENMALQDCSEELGVDMGDLHISREDTFQVTTAEGPNGARFDIVLIE